jgi:hypothetical protein
MQTEVTLPAAIGASMIAERNFTSDAFFPSFQRYHPAQ